MHPQSPMRNVTRVLDETLWNESPRIEQYFMNS